MACENMVITFSGFRDESLKAQIEEAGGKVAATIIKTTTHLLVKKDGKSSKKIEEAKEKNIEILDLDEFMEEHNFHTTEKKKASKPSKKDDEELQDEEHHDEEHYEKKHEEEKPNKQQTDMEILSKIMHTLTTKDKKSEAVKALELLKARINNI